jgi:PAS domain S-box-containing protein
MSVLFLVAALATHTVRVGYEENPPMAFTSSSGRPDGFYVELIASIAEDEGWELEFVPGEWTRLMQMLEDGGIDLLLSTAVSPARRELFLFPENAVYSGWSILAVKRSDRFNSVTDLEGARIAMIHDDIHSITFLDLADRLGVSVEPVWVPNFQSAMESVARGDADGAAVPWHILAYFGSQLNLQGSSVVWNPVQTSIAGNMQTAPALIEAIDRHLARMKSDQNSLYYALRAKWLYREHIPPRKIILYALGFLAGAVVISIIVGNLRLMREIRKKNRALRINSALAAIAGTANEAGSLGELCSRVVEALAGLLETTNLYVAIHLPDRDEFTIPRYMDRFDDDTRVDNPHSLTHLVFHSNRSIRWDRARIRAHYRESGGSVVGTPAEQWMGVPIRAGRDPVGVVAVQSYDNPEQFGPGDLELLEGVGAQLGGSILRLKAIEDLTASRRRLSRLMTADPSAVVLLDVSGTVQDCNPQALELLGRTEVGLIGKDFFGMLKRGAERLRQFLDSSSPDGSFRFIGQLSRPDGSCFPFEARASVFEEAGGRLFFLGIQDATRRLALEAEAARNERLESVGVLAGGIAHDFNNILTGILANLSLLKLEKPGSSRFSGLAAEAEKAAMSARHLTNQLLTFSQGGAPVKRAVPTAELLEQAARFLLRGSGVSFSISSEPDLWNLEADPEQFSQVVANLVLNAKQAMNDSGSLSISASNLTLGPPQEEGLAPGRYVRLTFHDSGPGIPGDIADRVFDPYFTTREKGHGLGLTTSHSIVARHGGIIRILPSQRGALFEVVMPAAVSGAQKPPESGRTSRTHRGRILVLDDEEIVRNAAKNLLEALGCESDQASDGATAVAMYREALRDGRPYDAVIMDLTVPGGMGGEQAVREVLAVDPGARVIVSSGYAGNSIMASYLDFGFSGVLSKPYTLSELSDVIRRVLKD